MRRTPLRRGDKPLQTHKPLERHVGLAQVGRRRREEAEATGKPVRATLTAEHRPTVPQDRRAELEQRSGGWCEAQLNECTGLATDAAHRRTQGMGGRWGAAKEDIDRLSDVLHLCRTCHSFTHAHKSEAMDDGLRLEDWQNPLLEPVLYRGVLSYLDDAGNVQDFEDVGA